VIGRASNDSIVEHQMIPSSQTPIHSIVSDMYSQSIFLVCLSVSLFMSLLPSLSLFCSISRDDRQYRCSFVVRERMCVCIRLMASLKKHTATDGINNHHCNRSHKMLPAAHCNTSQNTAIDLIRCCLQHIATHCITLQHTATDLIRC